MTCREVLLSNQVFTTRPRMSRNTSDASPAGQVEAHTDLVGAMGWAMQGTNCPGCSKTVCQYDRNVLVALLGARPEEQHKHLLGGEVSQDIHCGGLCGLKGLSAVLSYVQNDSTTYPAGMCTSSGNVKMPCQLKSHSGMEINGMVSCPLALRANTSQDLPSKWQWGVMDTRLMSPSTGTEEWKVVTSLAV